MELNRGGLNLLAYYRDPQLTSWKVRIIIAARSKLFETSSIMRVEAAGFNWEKKKKKEKRE